MNNKYIVKNCELNCNGECPNSETGFCEDCTDCLIKQVIEKCNEQFGIINSDYREGQRDVALEILQLFETEEVNNGR